MKIAIITGPTGGHFFPGLSIGERLRDKFDVVFFVPERDYIIKNLNRRNFKYIIIPVAKITKKNFIFSIFKFFLLVLFSIFIFLKERVSIVIGTGSYACVPYIFGAKILNKKILIHEQNFIPGKSTKILSRIANYIFLTFPNYDGLNKKKCIITGMPLLSQFEEVYSKNDVINQLQIKNMKTILVIGGSQGAWFINNLIVENLDYFKEKKFQIIHIAGKDKEYVERKFNEKNVEGKVYDFFYEMNKLYTIADYCICRAGAGTIVEIVEKEIPSFFIPYPYAGGHQSKNASFLSKMDCGFLAEEKEIKEKGFISLFEEFLKKCPIIKENLKKIKLSDKNKIKEIVCQISEKRKNQ